MAASRSVDRLFGIKDGDNPRIVANPQSYDGAYLETEPTVDEFFREHIPTVDGVRRYLHSLFPFIGWIGHYNLTWLFGDFVAGT